MAAFLTVLETPFIGYEDVLSGSTNAATMYIKDFIGFLTSISMINCKKVFVNAIMFHYVWIVSIVFWGFIEVGITIISIFNNKHSGMFLSIKRGNLMFFSKLQKTQKIKNLFLTFAKVNLL